MKTKNARAITPDERAHMGRVKELACSVCNTPGPSEAHHVKQGCHMTTIALCPDCHRGSVNGWHGQKAMWRIHKLDEIDALNITIKRLQEAS